MFHSSSHNPYPLALQLQAEAEKEEAEAEAPPLQSQLHQTRPHNMDWTADAAWQDTAVVPANGA